MTTIRSALLALITLNLALYCAAEGIEVFRWEHRVLMVFAQADQLETLTAQLDALEEEVLDRHVLWFIVDGDKLNSNYNGPISPGFAGQIAKRYHTNETDNLQVVLVGKDGGVKYSAEKLQPVIIFATIDRMPMRQEEMSR